MLVLPWSKRWPYCNCNITRRPCKRFARLWNCHRPSRHYLYWFYCCCETSGWDNARVSTRFGYLNTSRRKSIHGRILDTIPRGICSVILKDFWGSPTAILSFTAHFQRQHKLWEYNRPIINCWLSSRMGCREFPEASDSNWRYTEKGREMWKLQKDLHSYLIVASLPYIWFLVVPSDPREDQSRCNYPHRTFLDISNDGICPKSTLDKFPLYESVLGAYESDKGREHCRHSRWSSLALHRPYLMGLDWGRS